MIVGRLNKIIYLKHLEVRLAHYENVIIARQFIISALWGSREHKLQRTYTWHDILFQCYYRGYYYYCYCY